MADISNVKATITQIVPPSSGGTNGAYPARSIGYIGDIQVENGGLIRGANIGRPAFEVWNPPLLVYPLELTNPQTDRATEIHGLLVNNRYIWFYCERPAMGPCAPDGGGQ